MKLPTVQELESLDVYRDGGSISLSFVSNKDVRFTLFFGANIVSRGEREFEKLGYKLPVLTEYVRVEQVNPVTGRTSFIWKENVNSISWGSAKSLLNQIQPKLVGFVSDYLWVFEEMMYAASTEGHLSKTT